ncbi:MAG TPA: enoyl-CoA hydratase/isomerase family protein [Phycisphaerales bacterium]|nr:enoyl-CoA hydratase/isomerase family protein [Phycisphaerales bacterium]
MSSTPPSHATTSAATHAAPVAVQPLPVQVEREGPYANIAVVMLEQPGKPVVVLDHPLIQRLEAAIKGLPGGLRGLILASASDRVFVAGADLKSISEWDDDQLHRYLAYGSQVFGLLSQLPFPTVAAINGAALGGGLELAMHCDGLIASPPASKDGAPGKPYPVGLPEAGLSLCPGWGGTNLLPARMDPSRALALTAAGTPMTFDQAKEAGLFDDLAGSAAELLETCKKWIVARSASRTVRDGAPSRWIGRGAVSPKVMDALSKVKIEVTMTPPARAVFDAADTGLSRGWQAALEVEQRHLVHLRHTPPSRAALAAFFAKSAPPKA